MTGPKPRPKKEYDAALRTRALTSLFLRVAVAGYLCYMAYLVFSGMLKGSSPIPVWCVWAIVAVFAVVAVGFCVYAWKAFRKALTAAEVSPPPEDGDSRPEN